MTALLALAMKSLKACWKGRPWPALLGSSRHCYNLSQQLLAWFNAALCHMKHPDELLPPLVVGIAFSVLGALKIYGLRFGIIGGRGASFSRRLCGT